MTVTWLKDWVRDRIYDYPGLEEEIRSFYELALDEIEDGDSESTAISKCVESINELIHDNYN